MHIPAGLQIGGGITDENAREYLDAGASHVIVTSYVFRDGQIRWDALERLAKAVGRERVVIDLSCRKKEDGYYVVTNRWQTFTDVRLTEGLMDEIADYCDEFLIHGVDVEGKRLPAWMKNLPPFLPLTGDGLSPMQGASEALMTWNGLNA